MRQVIKHRDIRLLKMIRRTDPVILNCSPLHLVTEMKHLTPYRKNETSLSPVRGRGMGVWGWIKGLSYEPNWAVP